MAAISQTIFSDPFSWIKFFILIKKNHRILFLSVQLTTTQHWFRWWPGAEWATSHHPNQCWPDLLKHICGTSGRWVKLHISCRRMCFASVKWCPKGVNKGVNLTHFESVFVGHIPFAFTSGVCRGYFKPTNVTISCDHTHTCITNPWLQHNNHGLQTPSHRYSCAVLWCWRLISSVVWPKTVAGEL